MIHIYFMPNRIMINGMEWKYCLCCLDNYPGACSNLCQPSIHSEGHEDEVWYVIYVYIPMYTGPRTSYMVHLVSIVNLDHLNNAVQI